MKKIKLQNLLDDVWASEILSFDFDMIRNRIMIEVEVTENKVKSKHSIALTNVSSYFYVNDIEEMRSIFKSYEDGDYLELTSISVIEEKADVILASDEKWIEQYKSKINIAIEIWNKYLFVEAGIIIVDGSEFLLTT